MESERMFENDVKINRFALEKECEEQASIYYFYASELADLRGQKDKKESALKLTMAQVDQKVRKEYATSGAKITETGVKTLVDTDEAVVTLINEIDEINTKIYTLEAGVKSLEQKKSQLDNLVQLWIKGYYAAPTGGKPNSTDDAQKEARKQLNEKKEA